MPKLAHLQAFAAVPGVGFEPTSPVGLPILSRLRIPVPPPGPYRPSLRERTGASRVLFSSPYTDPLTLPDRLALQAHRPQLLDWYRVFIGEAAIGPTVEVTALKPNALTGLRGPSPLLRLQPDERLIALTRRGQHAAFETLFSRYQARLLSFCRHMLGSKEDAEDVLQEVFVAAFNAVLADERPINVRPWLYRIARNRSLNHLRRASAIGVDSMDIHFADHGLSTGEKVMRRESFRQLIGDVQHLPETQRTALLLREIDALSYDQIAQAMETTVPSVKSLLVRARISLAEAAEARKLSCEEVRLELGEVAEGLVKIGPPARRHLRDCERCRTFRKHLKDNNHALAAVLPVAPLLLLKRLILTKLGSTASAGGAHVAGAGGATAGASAAAGAGAGAAGGASAAGGLVTAGASAIATKAAATIAAAALVTAGAVEADHAARTPHHPHTAAATSVYSASVAAHHSGPLVVRSTPQPLTVGVVHIGRAATTALTAAHHARRHPLHRPTEAGIGTGAHTPNTNVSKTPVPAVPPVAPTNSKPPIPQPVTQVTTETTQLPPSPSPATQPTTSTTPTEPPSTTTSTSTTPAPPAPAAPESPEPTGEAGGSSTPTPPAGEPQPAGAAEEGSTPGPTHSG
jgi:RNA polymerase sigma factor (sigma-70 family)